MADHTPDLALGVVSRRDLLRLGAAAGALGVGDLLPADAEESGGPFLVKPYLQLGDAPTLSGTEQLVVMWHTDDRDADWAVAWQEPGAAAWTAAERPAWTRIAVESIAPHRVYRVRLVGLKPGGEVVYRVHRNTQPVFQARARARKSARQPHRFVVMGDCGTGSKEQKKVAYQVHRHDPDFVLIPGDIVYNNGRISEYRPFFFPPYSVDRAAPELGAPLLRSTLFLAGRGQHDTEASLARHPDAFAYYLYWSLPLNGPPLKSDGPNTYPLGGSAARQQAFLEAAGDRYPTMASYSFDFGNSHWTVLDTWNPRADWNDPALRAWLKRDLAGASGATWKFVACYLPPFNSSTAFPHTQKMRVVADVFEAAGVDIVFSGYAHSYQRTYPLHFVADPPVRGPVQDPGHKVPGRFRFDRRFDGKEHTTPDGVLYIVSGGGGNPGLHSPEQTDNPKTWQPFTVRYNASVNQFTLVAIDGRELTLRQVSLDGTELDRLTIRK
jgi:hypothetical protein